MASAATFPVTRAPDIPNHSIGSWAPEMVPQSTASPQKSRGLSGEERGTAPETYSQLSCSMPSFLTMNDLYLSRQSRPTSLMLNRRLK